jgi:hypothetical protein
MNGYTTLADRVASLLPKITAGACIPASSWSSWRIVDHVCESKRSCHYSCHGGAVCGAWEFVGC